MTSLLETQNGRFVGNDTTELDRLFQHLAASPEPRLLLQVHGGLVTDTAARQNADWLDFLGYSPLKSAGWETSYLIWHSGFLQTIGTNWREIAADLLFGVVRSIIRRWLMRKAGNALPRLEMALGSSETTLAQLEALYGDAEFREPEAIQASLTAEERAFADEVAEPGPGDELYDALASDPELLRLSHAIAAALTRRATPGALWQPHDEAALLIFDRLDAEVQAEVLARWEANSTLIAQPLFAPVFWGAAKAGYRALKRAISRRDHGFQATVIEELMRALYLDRAGSAIWGAMKNDVRDHFAAGGAGTEFLERLGSLAASTSGPVRLLFVGHSAGSILACELLARAGALPSNVVIDFIFLAPAVRIDKAAGALAAANSRLNNIRVFTMTDERERGDALDGTVPLDLYPHSLLYLISGILERHDNGSSYVDAPLLGMQRHLSLLPDGCLTQAERTARSKITSFLAAGSGRLCFAGDTAGGIGLDTDAHTHGTYDNDIQTLSSICHVGKNGF